MPSAITVRDVPDDARDELAARAARSRRSLQEYLRARLIDMAATPDVEEGASPVAEESVFAPRVSMRVQPASGPKRFLRPHPLTPGLGVGATDVCRPRGYTDGEQMYPFLTGDA